MILEPTEIKCTGVNFTTDAFKSLRRINKLVKDKTEESEDDGKDDSSITISCHPSKTVAIVLINKKSGGQVGNEFIKAFYRALNPLQVISILDEGLDSNCPFMQSSNCSASCQESSWSLLEEMALSAVS